MANRALHGVGAEQPEPAGLEEGPAAHAVAALLGVTQDAEREGLLGATAVNNPA
jgi:hypothetical protein